MLTAPFSSNVKEFAQGHINLSENHGLTESKSVVYFCAFVGFYYANVRVIMQISLTQTSLSRFQSWPCLLLAVGLQESYLT